MKPTLEECVKWLGNEIILNRLFDDRGMPHSSRIFAILEAVRELRVLTAGRENEGAIMVHKIPAILLRDKEDEG